ncbi:MAG: NAD(P)H-quinone oxidoreductase subunit 5 [Cellvibrionaceae bacterium]|jgi:NAD(P)H-quinone oxidoreductase subunit 5
MLAAHKKFVLSRVTEILLLAALAILAFGSGSLLISDIIAFWANSSDLPWTIELAVVLLALAAIIKCAQILFHGWLLQVMEAPTPISALLHAGIINIGGFLLLRFADVLALASFAQWLLLIVGALTAIIASLTLMTRISIKVMLAWSVCAQMGFMLMEIALGFYILALLHLVAHSFYKASSFLSSGDIVDSHIRSARDGSHGSSRGWHWLVSGSLITGIIALLIGIAQFFGIAGEMTWGTMIVSTILAIGITIFIAESLRYPLQWLYGLVALSGLSVLSLYLPSQQLFSTITAGLFPQLAVTQAQVSVVMLAFSLFFLLFVARQLWPNGGLSRRLYPIIYASLYLDEWFYHRLLHYWSCKQLPQKLTETSHSHPQPIANGSTS